MKLFKSISRAVTIAALLVTAAGCAQFRITEIQASAVLSLPAHLISDSNKTEGISAGLNDRVVFNLPVYPAVSSDQSRFLISDPYHASVKLFRSGQRVPQKIYSKQPDPASGSVPHVKVALDSAGLTAFDSDDTMYIQNFPGASRSRVYEQGDTHPAYRLPGELNPASSEFLPSEVIVISEDDEILHTIGSFKKILRLTGGGPGQIYILHENDSGRVLSLYENGQKKYEFSADSHITPEDKKKFLTETEDIVPVFGSSSPAAIASLVFRNSKTYEPVYRSVVRISADTGIPSSEILRITDAGDSFAWVMPDGSIYISSTEGESTRILFKIYSPSGEYLSNRLIEFSSPRSAWREYWFDSDGSIYSSRFHRNTFEIHEWK